MRENGFSLSRILPYKDRICDSVLIRENTGQLRPVFLHSLCSVIMAVTCEVIMVIMALQVPLVN